MPVAVAEAGAAVAEEAVRRGAGAAATADAAVVGAGAPAVQAPTRTSRLLLLPATRAAGRLVAVAAVVAAGAAGAITWSVGVGAEGLGRLEAVAGPQPLAFVPFGWAHNPMIVELLVSLAVHGSLPSLPSGKQTVGCEMLVLLMLLSDL